MSGRELMRKRIYDPNNSNNYFDVPVLASVPFVTMQDQAQERTLFFNNSVSSSRIAHTKRVSNAVDTNQYVDVERVDEFHIKDMQSQAQDISFVLTNHDPPPIQLDGTNLPAHQTVHYVRFFRNNDEADNCYGDMELIDQMVIRDSFRGQEWRYYLRWPALGDVISDATVPYTVTKGYCDPDLPLAPS